MFLSMKRCTQRRSHVSVCHNSLSFQECQYLSREGFDFSGGNLRSPEGVNGTAIGGSLPVSGSVVDNYRHRPENRPNSSVNKSTSHACPQSAL